MTTTTTVMTCQQQRKWSSLQNTRYYSPVSVLHHHHSKCRWLLAKLVINYSLTISTAARPHWLALMLLHFDQVCVCVPFLFLVCAYTEFPVFLSLFFLSLSIHFQCNCRTVCCGMFCKLGATVVWPGLVWPGGMAKSISILNSTRPISSLTNRRLIDDTCCSCSSSIVHCTTYTLHFHRTVYNC